MNDSAASAPAFPATSSSLYGAGFTSFAGPSLVNAHAHIDAAQRALSEAEPHAWQGSGASRYTSLRSKDLARIASLRTAVEAAEAALVLYLQARELMANALCTPGGAGVGLTRIPYGAVSPDALSYALTRKASS